MPEVVRDFVRPLCHITARKIIAMKIRTHDDGHRGQVLYTGGDFAIIDFEDEPNRPVTERLVRPPDHES